MHRSYQPLKPVTNRYLQQRWDQKRYDAHRKKVRGKVEECRARLEVQAEALSTLVSFPRNGGAPGSLGCLYLSR